MRRWCFWMIGAAMLCANQAHAQDTAVIGAGRRVLPEDPRLQSGRRVRIWSGALSALPAVGVVTANTGDSLVLSVGFRDSQGMQAYRIVRAAASQIDTLDVEVRTPRRSQAKAGAILGMLVGAIGSAASVGSHDCDQALSPCGRGIAAIGGGLLGFLAGAVIGSLLGVGDNVDFVAIPLPPRSQ